VRRRSENPVQRFGFGRFPNSLVETGAWGRLHDYMQALYAALLALCKKPTTYRDDYGEWKVAEGFPTTKGLARAAGVRRSSVSAATDRLAELGIIGKRRCRVGSRHGVRYIVLPPEHPIFDHLADKCTAMIHHYGDKWGLSRFSSDPTKEHGTVTTAVPANHPPQSPPWRQRHSSPGGGQVSIRTDTPKDSHPPIGDTSTRRMGGKPAQGSALRDAPQPPPPLPLRKFRWSQLDTAREKIELSQLVTLFAAQPRAEWEQLTVHLQEDGIRLRITEEAKRIATGIVPRLPSGSQGAE